MVSKTELPTVECKNLQSAFRNPDSVDIIIKQEVDKGYLVGPFKRLPFDRYRVSPIAGSKIEDHLIQTLGRWSSQCYTRYIRTSLSTIQQAQQALVPFIQQQYPNGHRVMQDNDPKHVSRSSKAFMQNNGINHWVTPPESPDMNPIENLWEYHIRRRKKPTNQQELLDGIQEFWDTVTPAVRLYQKLWK
ncbi:Hypothetical predicted protein [Mytilus galloprovincialis]|uniref:Tc1-like transposase DDE domain-containing protein n=1 Tax=Mytilus galloprovincialis TaxID=29158 RepID=A0A8B6DQA5_MYTGA|nr:Hypothetical predicted protein [Mytilus galloprovincialis]